MPETVIEVSGLSKKYAIGHLQEEKKSVLSLLRDGLLLPFKRLGSALRGNIGASVSLDCDLWALKDVSFEVKRGEKVGIIGDNGAGKSTLLRVLAGITCPTEGRVECLGRMGAMLEVGTGFHHELTGRENVYLNGAILGLPKQEIDKRFNDIVEYSGVKDFIDTPVKFYSTGMLVRLAFSVAAHLDPDILLVDEVLAVGDKNFTEKCTKRLQTVANGGGTLVFCSHSMGSVRDICDRVLLIQKGRLVLDGPPGEVIDYYLNDASPKEAVHHLEGSERTGGGSLRFVSTWLEGADGTPTSRVASGDKVCFAAEYEIVGDLSSDLVFFSFNILLPGDRVALAHLNSNTALPPYEGSALPIRGIVRCEVDRIPLAKGDYAYQITAAKDGSVLDWVLEAGLFAVDHGDFYARNIALSAGNGPMLVNQHWDLGPNAD